LPNKVSLRGPLVIPLEVSEAILRFTGTKSRLFVERELSWGIFHRLGTLSTRFGLPATAGDPARRLSAPERPPADPSTIFTWNSQWLVETR